MVNIVNKSILYKKNKKDCLRVCVMRRIRPEYDFDIWIPKLAPSEKLLREYILDKKIPWKQFSLKFKKQVLLKNKHLIFLLLLLSKITKISLLCGEKSAKHCHRKLIIEECKKLNKKLKIILK